MRSELGVAPEADHLDPDPHLLDGPDGGGEVAVAGDDDRDVEVSGRLHHVDDELDVEVGLDLAVAVLANVLADDLEAVPVEERVEVALVLVLRSRPVRRRPARGVAAGGGDFRRRSRSMSTPSALAEPR